MTATLQQLRAIVEDQEAPLSRFLALLRGGDRYQTTTPHELALIAAGHARPLILAREALARAQFEDAA